MGTVSEFEVENILEHRFICGKIEYKVKWKGYSEKHNTWEPPCSFTDRSLLRDYHEQVRVRNLQKDLYLADIAGPSGTSTSRKDKHSSTTRKKKSKHHSNRRRIVMNDSSDSGDDKIKDDGTALPGEPSTKIRISLNDLEVEQVKSVHMVNATKKMVACVKFKYVNKLEMIPIKIAHKKCPQLLIKYYENRIYWRENGALTKNAL